MLKICSTRVIFSLLLIFNVSGFAQHIIYNGIPSMGIPGSTFYQTFPEDNFDYPIAIIETPRHEFKKQLWKIFQTKTRTQRYKYPGKYFIPSSKNSEALNEDPKNDYKKFKQKCIQTIINRKKFNNILTKLFANPRLEAAVLRRNPRKLGKRDPLVDTNAKYKPALSSGSLTNLNYFFKDLSGNVYFSETNKFAKDFTKILNGIHPLKMAYEGGPLQTNVTALKTSDIIHAIRNYRPNQKIRSLYNLHPPGYHASHLIDPNYMWVGLG